MSAPTSRGKMDYIKEHKIHVLFEQLAGNLLNSKPTNPIPFLIEQLKALEAPANNGAVKASPSAATEAPAPAPPAKTGPYKVTLAVFGLDGAGKSTLISAVAGEVDKNCPPTVGFSPNHFQSETWDLMMFDLGGGAKFRGIWKEYYSELHGILFVVDAAAPERIEEAKEALWGIMDDPRGKAKPLLVFANKQDMSSAKSAGELEHLLGLTELEGSYHVFGCSAIADPVDEHIEKGLEWILEEVTKSFDDLSSRIKVQLAEDKARRKQALLEQQKRVEEYRKEWDKEEKEKEDKEEKKDTA